MNNKALRPSCGGAGGESNELYGILGRGIAAVANKGREGFDEVVIIEAFGKIDSVDFAVALRFICRKNPIFKNAVLSENV